MSFENPSKAKIIMFLSKIGCCKRCAIRYVGGDAPDFEEPDECIANLLSEVGSEDDIEYEVALKKTKINPCVICLDLLQDSILESMLLRSELTDIMEYDCDLFVNYISYPISVLIREHSMEMYVKSKFPDFFENHHVVPINKAWSLSIQNPLGLIIDKTFDRNALLQIQFNTSYELEEEETTVIRLLNVDIKKTKRRNDILSKSATVACLKAVPPEYLQEHISIPPQPPRLPLIVEKTTYKHDFIYIAGRYNKYSRTLFQTPWVLDDNPSVQDSVQEIIFRAINNMFNCSNLVFSSSGREDYDVRMLGRGRPFFIKISDPKATKILPEEFRLVEEAIKRTKIVKVQDLQIVDRSSISGIKLGEQFKKKTYKALCIVDQPEKIAEYIVKINTLPNVIIQQNTPLRVYHRRSADIRERQIYSIEARAIFGNSYLFELVVVTQAGTYVKEFVHGDLGRTIPSLCELIGGNVDIIALDVMDIHLDFPPPVIY